MRTYLTAVLVCALAAAGFAASTLVAPARAATGLADLAGLGYSLSLRVDASRMPQCPNYWVLGGNGAPETLLGDYNAKPGCNTAAELQARIDRLLADYPPRPAPATTATVTVTLPGETVTTPALTLPAVTVTAPAVTTPTLTTTVTVEAAAPPAQTVVRTDTVTTTATTTVADPAAVATITALRAKLAAARAKAAAVNTRIQRRCRTSPRRTGRARP